VTLTFTPLAGAGSEHAATTDTSGYYHVDLKPATYTVRASGPGGQAGGLAGEREVVVAPGKAVTADFVYTIQLM
jgi:hypothetical protein